LKPSDKTAINYPLHQSKPFIHDLRRVSTEPIFSKIIEIKIRKHVFNLKCVVFIKSIKNGYFDNVLQ